jgi:hypothetical protein
VAKDSKSEQRQLADAFRVAHRRADKDLEGFARAFPIRDQLLSRDDSAKSRAAVAKKR